jgi:hypothetical protein
MAGIEKHQEAMAEDAQKNLKKQALDTMHTNEVM